MKSCYTYVYSHKTSGTPQCTSALPVAFSRTVLQAGASCML